MRRAQVFTALADTTRRAILERLSTHGPCTATQLSSDMPISRQAVAKHLTHLRRADLVAPERSGRETHYRLTPAILAEAVDWLEAVCSGESSADERAA
jgi:DNA-binding transcriptional ArsR family regulator